MISLTVPEVRRLVLAMALFSVEERDFREGLSARVVGVEAGASGSCRPLQKGKPSRESGSQARRIVRGSCRSEGHRAYPGRIEAYRHRMGVCPSAATAAKRPDRQAAKRSPPGARRHPVGRQDRFLLARNARGVRMVVDVLLPAEGMEEARLVATYPPRAGRRRAARTGDQRR